MYKKYIVRLTEEQRTQLETLVRSGRAHARKLLYGRILLKADADGPDRWTDERIADAFEVSTATVARERRRFCEEGLEVALMPRKPGRPRRRVLDGRAEAQLVALSCLEPPEGRGSWTLRLLADRMVELGHVEEVSYETVRRTLKKLPQGPPRQGVGDPAEGERGVRVAHGGGVGPLRGALRPEEAHCVLRRAPLPAFGRRARASAGAARGD